MLEEGIASELLGRSAALEEMEAENTPAVEPATADLIRQTVAASSKTADVSKQPTGGRVKTHDTVGIIHAYVREFGLISHVNSYNELVNRGLQSIMSGHFKIDSRRANVRTTPAQAKISTFRVEIQFGNVKVIEPFTSDYNTGNRIRLLPAEARRSRQTYSGDLRLTAAITITAYMTDGTEDVKTAHVPQTSIGKFPIMVKSDKCHLKGCDRETLKSLGEDPTEEGGYCIVRGSELVCSLHDNILYNSPHYHQRITQYEHIRMEYISQAGDVFENSSMIRVIYYKNGQIVVMINSTKFDELKIPLCILYRVLGMSSDREIIETLMGDGDVQEISSILNTAFQESDNTWLPLMGVLDQTQLVQMIAAIVVSQATNRRAASTAADEIAQAAGALLTDLDNAVFPHLGTKPADRWVKLQYLSAVVRDMLRVQVSPAISATDRHHYSNKRLHGPGASLAKVFKTIANTTVVRPTLTGLFALLKTKDWVQITPDAISSYVQTELASSTMAKALEDFLISSEKSSSSTTMVVGRRPVLNRLTCHLLERKNILNMYAGIRGLTAKSSSSNKSSESAINMRKVAPSALGYVCYIHSPDTGENVGMRRQLAITASITDAGDSQILISYILVDSLVTPLNKMPDSQRSRQARVTVNGQWLGCTTAPDQLVKKYRAMRRSGSLDPFTTICIDPIRQNVEFWLDAGRLIRPLIIVRNTYESGGPSPDNEFRQWPMLTTDHVNKLARGQLSITQLVQDQVMEYITPEEQMGCLIAKSADDLWHHRKNPCYQYTHCEIPQATLGITALVAPYGHHTQPVRDTYCTNHARQAGGYFRLNYPFGPAQNNFLMYYPEMPLCTTIANAFVPPAGVNAMIAIKIHKGQNQEDSAIVCAGSIQRGLMAGVFYRTIRVILDKSDSFQKPNPANTRRMRQALSHYEKLSDGYVVRPGTIIQKNDALVGVVTKLPPGGADSRWVNEDRSEFYDGNEPAVVAEVTHTSHPMDMIVIKLRHDRQLKLGDKLSSRSGNKGIVAVVLPQSSMPYTEDGRTPDIIINPQSFPTRMANGQLIETHKGNLCASRGATTDATIFNTPDHELTIKDLVAAGFRPNGRSRMYDGESGRVCDVAVMLGPCHMLRLLKFVVDDEQAVGGSAPTDPLTGQPVQGKSKHGGLRLGEMEVWGLNSHGVMHNMHEKLHTDSDGRVAHVCRQCGNMAVVNVAMSIYECRQCGEHADISAVETTKSSVLLQKEAEGSNIIMTMGLKPRAFEEFGPSPFAL